MGDSWPIMNRNWSHPAEFERRRRPSLRQRIARRARTLAQLERARLERAMVCDLMHGRLDEQLVEFWEPTTGTVGAPQRKET